MIYPKIAYSIFTSGELEYSSLQIYILSGKAFFLLSVKICPKQALAHFKHVLYFYWLFLKLRLQGKEKKLLCNTLGAGYSRRPNKVLFQLQIACFSNDEGTANP